MAKLLQGDRFPALEAELLYAGKNVITDLFTEPKTVIWALRYIGCTVCRYDIHMAAKRYSEIQAKGAKIVFMLQSDKNLLQEELKDSPLPFDIICDPSMKLYQALDIEPAQSMEALVGDRLDDLKAKGAAAAAAGFSHGKYEGNEQQLPAMFIVDKDGIVEKAIYAENIVGLPTLDELLTILS